MLPIIQLWSENPPCSIGTHPYQLGVQMRFDWRMCIRQWDLKTNSILGSNALGQGDTSLQHDWIWLNSIIYHHFVFSKILMLFMLDISSCTTAFMFQPKARNWMNIYIYIDICNYSCSIYPKDILDVLQPWYHFRLLLGLTSCGKRVKGIHPTSWTSWAPNTNQRPFTEAFQIQNLQASVHSERVQGAPANRSRCIANQLSYWLLGLWLYQWQVQLLYRLYIHICIIYI